MILTTRFGAVAKTKSAKGKQRKSSPGNDNEIIKAALSRVLAKNSLFKPPVPDSVDQSSDAIFGETPSQSNEAPIAGESIEKTKTKTRKTEPQQQPGPSGQQSAEPNGSADREKSADHVVLPTRSRLGHASITPPVVSKKSKTSKVTKSVPCPVCLKTPFHLRYQCPIVLAGREAIETRIRELKSMNSGQEHLIEELETLIKSRINEIAKTRISNVNADSTSLSPVPSREKQQTPSNADDVADTILSGPTVLTTSGKFDPQHTSQKTKDPINSRIPDVSEGSSSDDDDSSESDRPEEDINIIEQSSPKITTSASIPTYTDVDLDALVRGPATSHSSIADILNESTIEEDEEPEDIALAEEEEEEDDIKFRRLWKRLERPSLSSDEDQELDVESGDDASMIDAPDGEIKGLTESRGQSLHSEPVSFQAMASENETSDLHRTGDAAFNEALAEDTAVLNIVTDDSDDNTRVAPPTEEEPKNELTFAQGQMVPQIPDQQESERTHPLEEERAQTVANPTMFRIDSEVAAEAETRTAHFPCQTDTVVDGNPPVPPIQEDDPIEPADDLLKLPLEEPASTPRPTALIKHLRTRSGRVITPTTGARLPRTLFPEKRASRRTGSPSLADAETTGKKRVAKAKSATPSRRRSTRLLSRPRVSVDTSSETDTPLDPVMATSKKPPNSKRTHPMVSKSSAAPLSEPQPSLDRWTTLQPSSQCSSTMTDQLHSSPRQGFLPKKRRHTEPQSNGKSDSADAIPQEPLFLPSESQVPFPYSQWKEDTPLDVHVEGEAAGAPASASEPDSEDEELPPVKRHAKSLYRRLTDIARQTTLFSTPSLTPTIAHSQSTTGNKPEDMYSQKTTEDGDESDGEEDSDDSSEEEEKSHIPKGRLAGVGIKR